MTMLVEKKQAMQLSQAAALLVVRHGWSFVVVDVNVFL